MAESSSNLLFSLWNKLQGVFSFEASSSSPLVVPTLVQLHEMVYKVYKPPLNEKPELEIVFLHGLRLKHSNEAHITTWMSQDNSEFWPLTWLVEAFPKARILTVLYDSAAKRTNEVGRLDLFLTTENLLSALTSDSTRVGEAECPIVLVGHCLGGLLLKELCLHANNVLSEKRREMPGMQRISDFFHNLRGMFFYGTPHLGSLLGDKLHDGFDGSLVAEIEIFNKWSARKNGSFCDLKSRYKWLTYGMGETRKTFVGFLGKSFHVVPEASSRSNMDTYYSVDVDHYDLCKPKGKQSSSFSCLGDFLHQIREQEARTQQLEKASRPQVARLQFLPDSKYVPFEACIKKVRRDLESETTGPIVAISGGPGQGKSSMARYLACLYQDGIDHTLETKGGPGLPLDNQTCPLKRFGDGVFFLHCGEKADSKSLLLQLWEDLGYQALTLNGRGESGATDEMPVTLQSEYAMHKQLSARLANQELLIILDDVWDPTIVEKLLVQQPGIKYLITTQKSRLWNDANCSEVPISRASSQEANQILANHVKGFPKEISSDLQDQVNMIIDQCDFNPLVLANVATNIPLGRAAELEEWETTQTYLLDLQDGDAKRPVSLYGRLYSKKTMGASVEMALSSFSSEEQMLLFVASICESQPIPEVVFKILFKSVHMSLAKFSRCCEKLETANFIQIEDKTVPGSSLPQKSWSIHTMRQNFISEIKKNEIALMFGTLLESIKYDDIGATLLVLYGQESWREQAARKMGVPINEDSKLVSSMLSSIKPFVLLLQAGGKEEWKQRSHLLAKQILGKYLHLGELDENTVTTLLGVQQTISTVCEALLQFAVFKEQPLFKNTNHEILQTLIHLLHQTKKGSHSQLEKILSFFQQLCCYYCEDSIEIASYPGVVERLVALLQEGVHPSVQEGAAWTLGQLSFNVVGNAIKIGSCASAIEKLAALLGEGVSPSVQKYAASTLGQLSFNVMDNARKIGSCASVVERLVALLGEGVSPSIQKNAAWALRQLSENMMDNAIKIGACGGAVEKLVILLGERVSPSVQQQAAWTLGQVSKNVVDNAIKIGACAGAVDRLVALLEKGVSPSVQQQAARTLGALSKNVMDNAIKIGSRASVVERLVALLEEKVSPSVQKEAAWALGQLSRNVVDNAIKIGSCAGAVDRLVALLEKGVSPSVQQQAAWTLGTLSFNVVDNAIKIGSHASVVERLVALLEEKVSPSVQKEAAWTLGLLSRNVVDNAIKIGSCACAVDRLVALLEKGGSQSVQEEASWTLGQLSFNMVDNAIKIGSCAGAVERLVALLHEGVSPTIQGNAAWALGQLSKNVADNAIKIGSCAGAVDRLVALLEKGRSPSVQEQAAWTLGELSFNVVDNAIKIGSYSGAVERLFALLEEGVSPSVRKQAAWTLGVLSENVVDNAIKIGSCAGAVERLVSLLEEGVSPSVQKM